MNLTMSGSRPLATAVLGVLFLSACEGAHPHQQQFEVKPASTLMSGETQYLPLTATSRITYSLSVQLQNTITDATTTLARCKAGPATVKIPEYPFSNELQLDIQGTYAVIAADISNRANATSPVPPIDVDIPQGYTTVTYYHRYDLYDGLVFGTVEELENGQWVYVHHSAAYWPISFRLARTLGDAVSCDDPEGIII